MKKITELTEEKTTNTHYRDEYGNLIRGQQEVTLLRPVRLVDGGVRFAHFIIDGIFFQILWRLLGYVAGYIALVTKANMFTTLTLGFTATIISMLCYPIFYFLVEHYWQRTPAKWLTKTIVIDEYGNKPDIRSLLLRSLVRIVPFESFSFLGNDARGWHDRWSNTYVVKETELAEIRKLQAEQSEKDN